jgi:hypothetical protein
MTEWLEHRHVMKLRERVKELVKTLRLNVDAPYPALSFLIEVRLPVTVKLLQKDFHVALPQNAEVMWWRFRDGTGVEG